MDGFLERLAARRRFGMKPGLETIRALLSELGSPERRVRAIHVAGTNGKGAFAAIADSVLRAAGKRMGRYTSPHLVRLNERFFLDGSPVCDATLARHAARVSEAVEGDVRFSELTFFEALTAVAFSLYGEESARSDRPLDYVALETGLGGRLDATNVCAPAVTAITRIGLDHCDWLGNTVEAIASEKAGIVKPGVPIVLGRNERSVRAVVEARAKAVGAPFVYAPDVVAESEIPATFALGGTFNRENAVTALAALRTLGARDGFALDEDAVGRGLAAVAWPGRFQRIGRYIVDGAHNPPAARALAESLKATGGRYALVAGFCGDKDVAETLRILAPFATRGLAVRTTNPRSLSDAETARLMAGAGIAAKPAGTLADALAELSRDGNEDVLVCGSLFLAGEAIVRLGAYPWGDARFDPSELLRA